MTKINKIVAYMSIKTKNGILKILIFAKKTGIKEAWMNWRKVIKGVGGGPWWEVASLIMATFLGFH